MNILTYTINTKNAFESDNFFRCLWSQLRYHFDNYGWNYFGHKNKNRIDLGFLDLGLGHPVDVSYDYKKKGCINNVYFKPKDLNSIKNKFDICVENSFGYKKYLKSGLVGFPIESPEQLFSFNGDYFQVALETKNTGILQLKINYYDEVDKQQEGTFRANDLIKLLNVANKFPIYYCNNFSRIKNKFSITSGNIKDLIHIDNFFSSYTCSSTVYNKIIDAATCYYNAAKLLYNNRTFLSQKITSIENNIISYEKTDYQQEKTDYQQQLLDIHYKIKIDIELSVVSFINTLEVLSLLENSDNSVCKSCNTRIYSISKKVQNFCLKFGSEEIASFIKEAYIIRSKIVHTGILIERRDALQGVVNPRFDFSQNGNLIKLCTELPDFLSDGVSVVFMNYIKMLNEN